MQGFSETVALVGFTRLGSERMLWEFSQICERKHLVKQSSKQPTVQLYLKHCCAKRVFWNAPHVKD